MFTHPQYLCNLPPVTPWRKYRLSPLSIPFLMTATFNTPQPCGQLQPLPPTSNTNLAQDPVGEGALSPVLVVDAACPAQTGNISRLPNLQSIQALESFLETLRA
jgi:hypothetical protein